MRIGIMGAMPEEIDSIKDDMLDVREEIVGNRTFVIGKLHNIETVLVFSKWGKVAAASTATTLIAKYGVNKIIFTGVAGAACGQLNIGDIVVSHDLYQHDMDAAPIYPKYEIPLMGMTYFQADQDLKEKALRACKKFSTQQIQTKIKPEILEQFFIFEPTICQGTIASGDQFIADADKVNRLKQDVKSLLAVEMEGGAVAHVCHDHEIPFVVIRIISDKADCSADINFQEFVTSIARLYSKTIVKNMYELML